MTKIQINLYFNPSNNPKNTKEDKGELFDWVYINDYNLFADAINNQLTDLFSFSNLSINTPLPMSECGILNTKYNILWNHLFNNVSGKILTQHFILSKYISIFDKISYLKNKFVNANQYRTLYIISDVDYDPIGFKIKPSFEDLIKVRDALRFFRKNDNFILLYIGIDTTFNDFENIKIEKDTYPHGSIFNAIINENWKRILDQFTFSKNIWN